MEKVYLFDDDGDEKALSTKYSFGSPTQSHSELQGFTLAFAYDYISLNKTNLCFDNPAIIKEDFHELYYLKQELASISVAELFEKKNHYRFHSIEFNGTRRRLLNKLGTIFNVDVNKPTVRDQLPVIYQIEVYTDNETKSPRICGFIGNYGIFHLLWFDYDHSIYPMKTTP